jgi:iron-sulfur cluster repair protein YtfE (RIC family)
MKRSDALAGLSRDHHHGLVVAQRLSRATAETASAARDSFLGYWNDEGHLHFAIEEDVLLPAFARHHAPDDPAVVRVLVDHVDLRRRAADLRETATPTPESLHELGGRLHDHVRHEERVLFPLIEAELPDAELLALATALEHSQSPRPPLQRPQRVTSHAL